MRPADDGGVRDAGAGEQHVLDLDRVDVLAAADDQFLDAAGDPQRPAAVDAAAEVPRAVPAVLERLRGVLGATVVADHQVRAADPDLALLAVGDVATVDGIGEPHLHAGHGQAAGIVVLGVVETIDRDLPAGLGAAVAVEQRRAEQPRDVRPQRRRTRRARGDAHAQPGQRLPARAYGVDQQAVRGGHARQDGERLPGERVRDARAPVEEVRARPHRDHAQQAQRVRVGMGHRRRPQQPVPRFKPPQRDVGRRHRPQCGALTRDHALAPPGGAGRVEDPGRLVQTEVVPRRHARIRPGQFLEPERARRRLADHHDPRPRASGRRPGDPGQQRRLGDDRDGAAVVEEVRQLRVRDPGVERNPYRPRPQDREATLHRLHPVAQHNGHPLAAPHPQPRQMPGQPPGPPLQLFVRHAPPGILEGGLAPHPCRVRREHTGHCTDQLAVDPRHPHPFGHPSHRAPLPDTVRAHHFGLQSVPYRVKVE